MGKLSKSFFLDAHGAAAVPEEFEEVYASKNFLTLGNCPSCSSQSIQHVGCSPTIHPSSRMCVDILKCSHCNHWFTMQMPSQELLAKLYSVGSLTVVGAGWESKVRNNDKKELTAPDSHWIVQALSSKPPGAILEVGPGDGALIRKFRKLGWKVSGIDPGQWSAESGIYDNAKNLPSNAKFNAIILQDVLEHCSNPWHELSQYRRFLDGKCDLFMTFPWSESTEAKLQGTKWSMVRPLGHLHYFSEISARNLAESINMRVLSSKIVSRDRRSPLKKSLKLLASLAKISIAGLTLGSPKKLIGQYKYTFAMWRSLGDQLYIHARSDSEIAAGCRQES